jgi:hypothetical protein
MSFDIAGCLLALRSQFRVLLDELRNSVGAHLLPGYGRVRGETGAMAVIIVCPECGLKAKALQAEDQVVGESRGKCRHRKNPLNCPSLRPLLPKARRELAESRFRVIRP